jgi:hypothetical protein
MVVMPPSALAVTVAEPRSVNTRSNPERFERVAR